MRQGLRQNRHYEVEIDLLQYALSQGYYVPNSYQLATPVLSMLKNDFKKYEDVKVWKPVLYNWVLAQKVFLRVLSAMVTTQNVAVDFESWFETAFVEAVQLMDKTTAAGELWTDYRTRGAALEAEYDNIKFLVKQVFLGQPVSSLWKVSPKVEMLPMDKLIVKHKERTFMCCDMVMYIVGLMLYGKQNDSMLFASDTACWSSVGMSMFKGSWDLMVRNLLRNGDTTFVGYDIKAMEASLSNPIFDVIYRARNSFIPGLEKAKVWFLSQLQFSYVVDLEGFLRVKVGGNPSGNLNTLTDNTLANILVLLYCFSFKYSDEASLLAFYARFPCKLMGDDSIMAYQPELHELIIAKTGDLGFTYELESQPGPLLTQKYLNCGFAYNDLHHMHVPVPNYEKLFASLYGYRRSPFWRNTLCKIFAMRVLCYNRADFSQQINDLIYFVKTKKQSYLENENNPDITYTACVNQYKTDEEIESLWFGSEGCAVRETQNLTNMLNSLFKFL